jgi:nitroreductase
LDISFIENNLPNPYTNEINGIIDIFSNSLQISRLIKDKTNMAARKTFAIYEGYVLYYRISKYKNKTLPDEIIYDLVDCARLVPSACNSQPWRFKVVKDKNTKKFLSKISFNQKHVAKASLVLVCCADTKGYAPSSSIGNIELYNLDIINKHFYKTIKSRNTSLKNMDLKKLALEVCFNAVIGIEHIVLRAVELGLGTFWLRLTNDKKIKKLFNWDESIKFVSLLTIGYPDEDPNPIRKLSIWDIPL